MILMSEKGHWLLPVPKLGWRAVQQAHTWQAVSAPWSADATSPTPSLGRFPGDEASSVNSSDGPAQCYYCLVLKARLPFVYSVFGHRIYKGKLSVSIKPWTQSTRSKGLGTCVHDRVTSGVWQMASGSPLGRGDISGTRLTLEKLMGPGE